MGIFGELFSKQPASRVEKPVIRESAQQPVGREPTSRPGIEADQVADANSSAVTATPLGRGEKGVGASVVPGPNVAEVKARVVSDDIPPRMPAPVQDIARDLLRAHPLEWAGNWKRMNTYLQQLLSSVFLAEQDLTEGALPGYPSIEQRYQQVQEQLNTLDLCMARDTVSGEVSQVDDLLTTLRSNPDTAAVADRVVLVFFIREILKCPPMYDIIANPFGPRFDMRYLTIEEVAQLDRIMGVLKQYMESTAVKTGDGTGEIIRLFLKKMTNNRTTLQEIFDHYEMSFDL